MKWRGQGGRTLWSQERQSRHPSPHCSNKRAHQGYLGAFRVHTSFLFHHVTIPTVASARWTGTARCRILRIAEKQIQIQRANQDLHKGLGKVLGGREGKMMNWSTSTSIRYWRTRSEALACFESGVSSREDNVSRDSYWSIPQLKYQHTNYKRRKPYITPLKGWRQKVSNLISIYVPLYKSGGNKRRLRFNPYERYPDGVVLL
jgi:hypothetical protein